MRGWRLAWVLMLAWGLKAAGDAGTDQFNFAEGLFIQGDHQSALEEFQTYAAKFPKGDHAPAAAYRIAECQFRLEQFAKAAPAFESALKRYPKADNAPLGAYNLGRSWSRLEKPKQAADAFRLAAATGKGQVREESLIGAGEALIGTDDFAAAAEVYEKLLAEFPKTTHRAAVLFSLGWVRTKLERYEPAIEAFSQLSREFPDYPDRAKAQLAMSDCYTALKQFDKSALLLQGLEADKEVADQVLLRQAWNLFRSDQKKKAADAFMRYADRFPGTPLATSAVFNAGISRFETGDYAGATPLFARAMETAGDAAQTADARYWGGLCLFNQGLYAETAGMLEPLIAKTPDHLTPEQKETLAAVHGRALAKTDRLADAIASLNAFTTQYPASKLAPNVSFALANCLAKIGKVEDAATVLKNLLTKAPDAELRPHVLFALGEFLYRSKKPKEALPYLEELAASNKADAKATYRLAWVLFDLDQFDRSMKAFAEVAESTSPLADEAQYMTGRAAEDAGKQDAASAAYSKLAASEQTHEFVEKALYRLGFLLKGDRATANLTRYTKQFPDGQYAPEMELKLAESAFADGQVQAAAIHYQAIRKRPGTGPRLLAAASYGLAWCQLKQGDAKQADTLFAQAANTAEAEPDLRNDALLQRGEIAYRDKRFAEAKSLFAKVAGKPQPRERATYMLGWSELGLGKPDLAAQHFQKLLRDYPNGSFVADASIRLARILNENADFKGAREVLKPLVAQPTDAPPAEDTLHVYGATLVGLEDWKPLLDLCDQLATAYPDAERQFLVSFRRGLAYQGLGMADQAEAEFRQTVEQTDTIEAAKAQFNIGSLYFARQQFLDAAKNFLRVEMLYDYDDLAPRALYHAAQSFRRAGQEDRAGIYEEKLKTKYADSTWTAKLKQAN